MDFDADTIQAGLNDNLFQQKGVTQTTPTIVASGILAWQNPSQSERSGANYLSSLDIYGSYTVNLPVHQSGQISQFSARIEDDFSAWLLEQSSALRGRHISSLDFDNLAEELEDMYAQLEKDLESDVRVVLEHLLKLEYEPSENEWKGRSRKWKVDTIEHRARIQTILEKSPKLRGKVNGFLAKQFSNAVRKVATQTSRRRATFPSSSPWSIEQILSLDFYPNPFNLPIDDE